jgi:hypothetical protein
MVHSAFHIEPVLKKSAAKITALEVWGSKVRLCVARTALRVRDPPRHVARAGKPLRRRPGRSW